MNKKLLLLIFLMGMGSVFAQNKTLWKRQSLNNLRVQQGKQDLPQTQTFTLDTQSLKQILKDAPDRGRSKISNVIVSFPNANGNFERFRVYEASNLAPSLAAQFPEIKSYLGKGVDDPTATIRFSVNPKGFSSMRFAGGKKATFIESLTADGSVYTVFTRDQKLNINNDFECSVSSSVDQLLNSGDIAFRNADDSTLRTYRLAVSASGGYTQFHGGTVADAVAAIDVSMARVNGIFEIDFAVTLEVIDALNIIYTNPSTDPYGGGSLNSQLQTTLTAEVGEANYDVGHLFATEGGNSGNAGCIGCVCVDGQKGSGWTSRTTPIGDPFDVDYVAHELGHQFGANHTWTHAGNEGTGVQAEPGSGTTIMSYAGITGPTTDVEPNVTPNFHGLSIEQVTDYIKSTSCQTNTPTGNVAPIADAGQDYTIPRGTPFILEGSATDADTPTNELTYVWEQIDNGTSATTLPSPTNTVGPAFRNYEPDGNPNRYFPRLETIKTGATSWTWEAVPNVARTLNFRLTVRDNDIVGVGAANGSDDVTLTVNGTAGPFVVNSPNTNITWNEGAFASIIWDVAGTTSNGVNAANVDIFLSTDGGDTYTTTLATGVANDGSHDIIVPPGLQGSQNRVMVRGENHIFFDISDTDFTIAAPVSCTAAIPTNLIATTVGFNSATLDWDAQSAVVFDVQYREVGSGTWIDLSTSSNTIDLTGLTELTDYEARVRSRCPDTTTSAYSGIINFTTTATPPCIGTQITSYPYLETFDVDLGDWTQGSGDDGDWTLNSGTTPSDNTGPSDDITGGGNYLYTEASTNGLGFNATVLLESPCFDLNGLTGATLSFYYHMFGADMGTLLLEVSSDNGISWTTLSTITGDQGNAWNFENIDLVSYLNENIKLRFTGTTGPGFTSDIAIDNIGIGPPIADTEAPVITLNGSSSLPLQIGDTYTELGATATDNVDGDLTSSIVIGGDTVDTNVEGTYTITYNVSDAAGNAAVEVTRTVIVSPYCPSFGDVAFQTGVTRVVFGSIDNADGPAKDVGYEDFTNISTNVTQATTVDLTVNVNTDGNFTVHAFAWIDWNQNDDFTDPGEEYDLGTAFGVEDGALPTLPILIPGDAVLGNTRMRVSARYNADPTPCLTDFDGEVEDYTIIVDPAGADTEAPVITLNGNAVVDLGLGGNYVELGASALDNVDGDISANIVIGGDTVDPNTLGTYVITYNVSDAAGNAAIEVTRTVNVIVLSYCPSNGNITDDEYINRVQLNTLDNDLSGPGTTSTGYSDFTGDPTLVTDLFAGTQYTITITPEWPGGTFNEGYSVWIDYNKNGDFTDPGEQVFTQTPTATTPVSGSFTLPSPLNVSYGETRMRVSLRWNAIPDPCGSFQYGEVEDYTVNIRYDGLLYSQGTWDPNAPNGTTSADNVLILDGTYNAASDIDINDIIVNTGATINIPKEFNINVGGNINNLGEFVLNSDSNEFSSLIVNGTITGNVKYNRHVNSQASGNDLVAPPVSGEAFTSFISNNSNVFANGDQSLYLFGPFDKPLNEYITYGSSEASTLNAGTGYRTASTDDGTFTFEGAVTNGSLNVPIVKTGIDFDKWNLIGNPYTSYIRLDSFLTANIPQLDTETAAVYGYDADNSDGSVWSIWNLAYLGTNPNALIAPGQAFFVSSPDGASTVSFTPAMQTTGSGDDFIQGNSAPYSKFILRMESSEEVSQTDFYLRNDTSLGLDVGFDAGLFEGLAPDPFLIYSSFTGGSSLNAAIQCINFNDANGSTTIPVGVNLPQGTQVTISLNEADVNYDVYFEDTLTNTTTLLNNSDYVVTASSDLLGTGRFFIRFEGETLTDVETNLDTLNVYSDSQNQQIVVEGQLMDDTEFILYDIQGRRILKDSFDEGTTFNTIDASNFANGVYLIQLNNSKGSLSKKLIIR